MNYLLFRFTIDYESSDPNMNFRIDPNDGRVMVRKELDRDSTERHELLILAIDEGRFLFTITSTCSI